MAAFFIEAIAENIEAKTGLFNLFAAHNSKEAIFVSNTSSLSISKIQTGVAYPERVAGMHFFNPAPVMKLVEVVKGRETSLTTIQQVEALCKRFNKVPVHCSDTPGFIVNRVARHYYLEALHIHETTGLALADIDELLEVTGFKMGPFKLMDLIGLDINLAVSESLYEAFEQPARFEPSALQREKVARGELGKKSGKGFYVYSS